MKKHLLKIIAILTVFSPNIALAQTAPVQTDIGSANNIGEYVSLFLTWSYPVIGSLAVLMFIWAGYLYMTSQGNQENISTAKEIITATILGLLLLFTARLLLSDIIGTI